MPEGVKGHRSLSSAAMLLSGIDLIREISFGRKRSCSRGVFQEVESRLIRSNTVTSLKPLTSGEVINGWNSDGSQGSDQALIFAPVPTLCLIPYFSTSLPTKILLHAYEPNWHSTASMMEQRGKNLDLKTL